MKMKGLSALLAVAMLAALLPAATVSSADSTPGKITVDGNIDDWKGVHSFGVEGTGDYAGKKVDYYGILTDEGIYLACDAYHAVYTSGKSDWASNSDFQLRVGTTQDKGTGQQVWVSAAGIGKKATYGVSGATKNGWVGKYTFDSVMNTVEVSDGGDNVKYHTVTEIFLSKSLLELTGDSVTKDGVLNYLRVGVLWKNPNDSCNNLNGEGNNKNGVGAYWLPANTDIFTSNKPYITNDGIYTPNQYFDLNKYPDRSEPESDAITVDGKLDDWDGVHSISLTGSGAYEGKKITYYGMLTPDGVYMACDVYHGAYTTKDVNWWIDCNFEMWIGMNQNPNSNNLGHQVWVSARNMHENTFPAIGPSAEPGLRETMKPAMITEQVKDHGSANYHTTVEVFLPKALSFIENNYTQDGALNYLRVGVGWKTSGDNIDNNEDGTGVGDYWNPKDTSCFYENKPYVTEKGIYTPAQYADLDKTVHEHSFGDWQKNDAQHWKACECGEKSDVAAHTFGDWSVVREATATQKGLRERTCSVCGYKQSQEFSDSTVTPPPTGDRAVTVAAIAVGALAILAAVAVFDRRKRVNPQ